MSPDRLKDPAMRAARAIDALRRGWPITITGRDGTLHLLPAETGVSVGQSGGLLISASRAATLKLANQRDAASPEHPVLIALPLDSGPDLIHAIIDPVRDLATPLKGPFRAAALPQIEAAAAAMELARHAAILPGFLLAAGTTTTDVAARDVAAFADPAALTIAAHARLPVAVNAEAHIYGFRSPADASDHIALVVGRRDATPPLVRLHSECLTGDVLGSLKCDCGPQLDQALRRMGEVQWGVLLYLRQEGRGIGLINKLRAYALQDQGFDTVDANQRLGFAVDARDFSIAARMLELMGISAVRLLTNNPEKVAGLTAAGITVMERVAHQIPANPHNDHYLTTKRDRTGHQL